MKRLLGVLGAVLVLMVGVSVQADSVIEGRAGRAEVRFLQGMIDHHQMAVDMAQHCLTQATMQEVLDICENVITAQTAEIEQMVGWLLSWYNISYTPVPMLSMLTETTPSPAGGHGGHAGHGASKPQTLTDPAMTMGMFAGLNRATGRDYDVVWLENMIDHHDDALHMAERILRQAAHPEVTALAQAIIADQTAEIALMEALLEQVK